MVDNFFETIRQLWNTSYFKHQGKICKNEQQFAAFQ